MNASTNPTREDILAANPLASHLERVGVVLRGSGDERTTNRCAGREHKPGHLCVSVKPSESIWHCHDCKTGGSVIDWIAIESNRSAGDVLRELGEPLKVKHSGSGRIVATYDYRDEAGGLLFQVVRMSPKNFRQRQPQGDGWLWKMDGVRRVPYRLSAVREAVVDGDMIVICEGEKDCDNLAKLGFASSCNPGGAESRFDGGKKWLPEFNQWFLDGRVVIIADKDAAGRKHAQIVARHLQPLAESVKVIELPDVAGVPVKDATDFLEAGGTAADLMEVANLAPEWTPTSPTNVETVQATGAENDLPALLKPHLSEDASEFEFANELAVNLPPIRTCGSKWRTYRDGAWGDIDRSTLRPAAQNILPEAIRTARREATLLDHLEGRLQTDAASFTGFCKFSADGEILLNCANGVAAISEKETRLDPHSPDHLFTQRIAANFSTDAMPELFLETLADVLPDAEDRFLYQLCAGNFLFPDCRYEAALVAYGEAGRGKSTVAEPVADALGTALVPRLTMGQICDPKSYHVPKLQFAAVNLGTEMDAIELGDSAAFKAIVSGEPVEARPIYGAPFTMRTNCKLWFLANSLPRFKHGTEAELRRTRFLRFDYLPPIKDVTLKSRLKAERDAVFFWMLDGLSQLLTMREIPLGGQESRSVHSRFKVSNDPVGTFVAERCEMASDVRVAKDDLRDAYAEFCESQNLRDGIGGWFFRSLYERWPALRETRPEADGPRRRCIAGITLKP